jgi:hypothetical protein
MKINYYNADNQIFIIELILLVISQNDPLNRKADKPERQNYLKSFSILSMAKWLLRQILHVFTQRRHKVALRNSHISLVHSGKNLLKQIKKPDNVNYQAFDLAFCVTEEYSASLKNQIDYKF